MNVWLILLAVCTAAGLIVAASLLWVGISAILHQHRLMRESAITTATLGPALHSIYDGTVLESFPEDFFDLLRELRRHAPRGKRHLISN